MKRVCPLQLALAMQIRQGDRAVFELLLHICQAALSRNFAAKLPCLSLQLLSLLAEELRSLLVSRVEPSRPFTYQRQSLGWFAISSSATNFLHVFCQQSWHMIVNDPP